MQIKQEVKKNPYQRAVNPRETAIRRIFLLSMVLGLGEYYGIPYTRTVILLATLAVLYQYRIQKNQSLVAFRKAAQEGNLVKVKELLNILGPELIDHTSSNGKSALHWAARYKREDVAKFLIREGANINLQDSQGNTPLHDAVNFEKNKEPSFNTIKAMVGRPYDFRGMYTSSATFNPEINPSIVNAKGEMVIDILTKIAATGNVQDVNFKAALRSLENAYEKKVGQHYQPALDVQIPNEPSI